MKKGFLANKNGRLIISAYKPNRIQALVVNCLFVPMPKDKTQTLYSIASDVWVKILSIKDSEVKDTKILQDKIKRYIFSLTSGAKKVSTIDVEYIGQEKFILDYHSYETFLCFPEKKKNKKLKTTKKEDLPFKSEVSITL